MNGTTDAPADDSGGARHKGWPPADSVRGGISARRGGSGARATHDSAGAVGDRATDIDE